MDLGVHTLFPDTAGDELRVLGTEIQNENAIVLQGVSRHDVSPRTKSSRLSRRRASVTSAPSTTTSGGFEPGVVVGRHHEAIGARRMHGKKVAVSGHLKHPVPCEEVPDLTDRPRRHRQLRMPPLRAEITASIR